MLHVVHLILRTSLLIIDAHRMNPESVRVRTYDEGAQLLKRCSLKDEAAFSRLYDLYSGLLYSVACRMLGASQEAEDAVQDSFLHAWERSGGFDPARGSARAWFVMLVRSRCLDRFRRRATRVRYETAAGEAAARRVDCAMRDGEWEEAGLRREVTDALDELPVLQRQVIEAALFENLSQQEIADKFLEPLGTVKTRMRHAARKLADRLGPVWNI